MFRRPPSQILVSTVKENIDPAIKTFANFTPIPSNSRSSLSVHACSFPPVTDGYYYLHHICSIPTREMSGGTRKSHPGICEISPVIAPVLGLFHAFFSVRIHRAAVEI